MDKARFSTGDPVRVKAGVVDPDTGYDMGGWQGRITRVSSDDMPTVEIQWDSMTLQNLPDAFIEQCETEGLDWSAMRLFPDDVVPAAARDTEADVERVYSALAHRFTWVGIGSDVEQGKRIQKVVNSASSHDEMAVFAAWHDHLEAHLEVPFEAEVYEYQRGPVRQGDQVTVMGISMLDDTYGTIVAVKHKRGIYELPLCDLKARDKGSANYPLADDYGVWFSNR